MKNIPTASLHRSDHIIFSESNSRFLIEVHKEKKKEFESFVKKVECSQIGRVVKDRRLSIFGLNNNKIVDLSTAKLRKAWNSD